MRFGSGMRRVATALGALLLTAGNASALPCAESYVEYREKMLLKGWESVECSEDMHTLYPDSYREVCVEDEHNWITAMAYWKTPEGWKYADPGAPPRIFGYTLLGKPGIALCVPPNIEFNAETERRPKPTPFVESPVALLEAVKNYIHPSRILF